MSLNPKGLGHNWATQRNKVTIQSHIVDSMGRKTEYSVMLVVWQRRLTHTTARCQVRGGTVDTHISGRPPGTTSGSHCAA